MAWLNSTLIQRFGSAANLKYPSGLPWRLMVSTLTATVCRSSTRRRRLYSTSWRLGLFEIITRTMRLLTRLGVLIEEPDRTYLAETLTPTGLSHVSGTRLVHLSDCARTTRWARSAELAKPAEHSQAVRLRAACQLVRL